MVSCRRLPELSKVQLCYSVDMVVIQFIHIWFMQIFGFLYI